MPLTIPDDLLKRMGMTEQEARIEIACRLYDAQIIGKPTATRLAELTRPEFEGELVERGLAVLRMDEQYVREEIEAAERLSQSPLRSARSGEPLKGS